VAVLRRLRELGDRVVRLYTRELAANTGADIHGMDTLASAAGPGLGRLDFFLSVVLVVDVLDMHRGLCDGTSDTRVGVHAVDALTLRAGPVVPSQPTVTTPQNTTNVAFVALCLDAGPCARSVHGRAAHGVAVETLVAVAVLVLVRAVVARPVARDGRSSGHCGHCSLCSTETATNHRR